MSFTSLGADRIAERLYNFKHTHAALPSATNLNYTPLLEQFYHQGFVAIDNVFSREEVATYRQAISDIIAAGDPRMIQFEDAAKDKNLTPEQKEAFVRKCYQFVEHEPRLRAMSEHPVLLQIIQKLIGEPVRLVQDMALLKPPLVGREKPWHQDMAYFDISPPELVIGTWTALDAATPENGCMHVIPGSHREGPKPHYHDRDCQLNDEDVDVERDVMVPLKPGGVLFFSALIHHGTPPNHSGARRRAIQLHYCATSCKKLSIEEHENLFHDSAGYAGCAGYRFGSHPPRPVVSKPENI